MKTGRQDLDLQIRGVLCAHQLVCSSRHGVLPELRFCWHQFAETADVRTHVTVRQLEPCFSERLGELIGVLLEALGDRTVDRIESQGEVSCQHGRSVALGGVVRIGYGVRACAILGLPLMRSGGTLREFPFVAEEDVEEVVVPFGGTGCPSTLEPTRNCVISPAGSKTAFPSETLLFNVGRLRLAASVHIRIGRAVGFAEGVSTGNESDRFFIIHGHAAEGLTNVDGRGQWIRCTVRTFRVDVDETHLHGTEGSFELALAAVALVTEPGGFVSPVNVILGLPDVLATTGEAEGLESHGLQSTVASKDHEVGP